MKIKPKYLISFVVLFLLCISAFLGAPKVQAFAKSHNYEKQGDYNFLSNQYNLALNEYEASISAWRRKEVEAKISITKDLIESENNYQNGSDAIQKEQWDQAIISLSKVKNNHKDYWRAQNLIDYAKQEQNKIEEKGKVEPVEAVVKQPKIQYREVRIMDSTKKCRVDKYTEIMETKEKAIDTICMDVYNDCADGCYEKFENSDCLQGCASLKKLCLMEGVSQAEMNSDTLDDLLDIYCID